MRTVFKVGSAMAILGLSLHSFRLPKGILESTRSSSSSIASHKLQLVFHVGPGKMGSSTIQSALLQSRASLADDQWVYYHHIPLGALNQCMVATSTSTDTNTTTMSCASKMEAFQQFVHQAEQNRQNIVLSTERWSPLMEEMKWYHEFLHHNTNYEVTIVVMYRRYYNWLPSRYYQFNRFRCRPHPANTVDLGRTIAPLPAFLSQNYAVDHPTVFAMASVSKYYNNTRVINIETSDLVQDFVCQILGAETTCQKVQSDRPVSANQGKTLAFDRLAQHLLENNMVDPVKVNRLAKDLRFTRKHGDSSSGCASLAMILEKHDERNGRSVRNGYVPLICPSTNVTDALFQASAEAERDLFPDEYSHESTWNDFLSKMNTTLFCDIDIEAVLSVETWHMLLEKLQWTT